MIRALYCIASILLIFSCANIGNPAGGPKDITPPNTIKSTPNSGEFNFTGKKIVIQFNENIILDKPAEKIFISPPMNTSPIVKAYGKKITVLIDEKENYQPNTTYTIDFGNSIQDNNEKNVLGEYALAFSTGSYIDSLRISGYIIYADNLDPAEGIYVGIYKDQSDSTFRKTVPLRIGKTDEKGYFSIKNVSPGTYRVMALKDANKNYKFDQKSEYIGFSEEDISPGIEEVLLPDTLWKDTITVDTIVDKLTKVYTPFDLLIPVFTETDSSFYFTKGERTIRERLDFYFTGKPIEEPRIEILNTDNNKDWYKLETSYNRDTLSYWITDSAIYLKDTLQVAFTYLKKDTNDTYQTYIDTSYLNFKSVPEKKRNKKDSKDDLPSINLKLSTNATGLFNIHDTIRFTSPTPVNHITPSSICLEVEKDSVRIDVPIIIEKIDLRNFTIRADLTPGSKYYFKLDSAAVFSIYGLTNKDLESQFTVRKKESYAAFSVKISNAPDNFRVQLLNESDLVISEMPVENNQTKFDFIEAGDYYLRGYVDANENSTWDTGNYQLKLQPEAVYYHDKKISVKVNWNITETWDLQAKDLLQQKPTVLKGKFVRDKEKNGK